MQTGQCWRAGHCAPVCLSALSQYFSCVLGHSICATAYCLTAYAGVLRAALVLAGVDAIGALTALLLSPDAQQGLQQAALALLLTKPLLPSVTAASIRAVSVAYYHMILGPCLPSQTSLIVLTRHSDQSMTWGNCLQFHIATVGHLDPWSPSEPPTSLCASSR